MTEEKYRELKKKYRGTYKRANDRIIPKTLYKILNYNEMIKNVDRFSSYENFINFYITSNRKIKYYIDDMVKKLNEIGIKADRETAIELLSVRLGNVYFGMKMENEILKKLANLAPHIICKKATDDEDMNYKVDATLEIPSVNKIGIQIKPESYKRYDSRSELPFHEKYFLNTGNNVVYFYYDNEYNINVNNEIININDTEKLIPAIEKLF